MRDSAMSPDPRMRMVLEGCIIINNFNVPYTVKASKLHFCNNLLPSAHASKESLEERQATPIITLRIKTLLRIKKSLKPVFLHPNEKQYHDCFERCYPLTTDSHRSHSKKSVNQHKNTAINRQIYRMLHRNDR